MMMEILFNELSLTGQFSDQEDSIKNGLIPFISVLKEIEGFSFLLLKKSDLWNYMVTPSDTLHSILINKSDEVRRFKSALVRLTKEPFWDVDTKQCSENTYFFNGFDIRGTSPAEACERDQVIISFALSKTSLNPLNITKNGKNIKILNLMHSGEFSEFLWERKKISFESFIKSKFSKGKLDFSKMDEKIGFHKIHPSEEDIFVEAFKKFENLSWKQIYTDKGFNYKEYHENISIHYRGIKTYKFRVSQKFRCHG
jgi:hypothetical protein